MDCIPSPDTVHSGAFDLTGMLAGLGAQASAIGARRVDFPALPWDPFMNVNNAADLATARRIAEIIV